MNKKIVVILLLVAVILIPLGIKKAYSSGIYSVFVDTPLCCYGLGMTIETTITVVRNSDGYRASGVPVTVEIVSSTPPALNLGTYYTNGIGEIYLSIPVNNQYFWAGSGAYLIEGSIIEGAWPYDDGSKVVEINFEGGAVRGGGGSSPFVKKKLTEVA